MVLVALLLWQVDPSAPATQWTALGLLAVVLIAVGRGVSLALKWAVARGDRLELALIASNESQARAGPVMEKMLDYLAEQERATRGRSR